jgi:hypothetical protein
VACHHLPREDTDRLREILQELLSRSLGAGREQAVQAFEREFAGLAERARRQP